MSKRTALGVGVCGAFLLLGTGCVMPDQLSQMEKDLADVRREMREVREDQQEALDRLAQIETRVDEPRQAEVSREDLTDLGVQIEQVSRGLMASQERMDEMDQRVGRLVEEARQAREMARQAYVAPVPSGGNAPGEGEDSAGAAAAGADALPDPEALYNTAYSDYSKGNYALAISGFQEFQERFPDSAQADNALYWVSECHFSQGDFGDAVSSIDRLLELYPESDRAAAGNLKKALAYLEQNQIGQAIVQLRYVNSSYPGTDEAKIARDKLTSLGAPI